MRNGPRIIGVVLIVLSIGAIIVKRQCLCPGIVQKCAKEKYTLHKQEVQSVPEYSNADIPIETNVNEQFVIVVESYPTTGYEWKLARPLDEKVLRLAETGFRIPEKHLVGAPSVQVWKFEVVGSGETLVAFEYVRSWEKDVPPAKETAFTVRAR